MKRLATTGLGIMLLTAPLSAADADEGFRCGTGRLVDRGDRIIDVRNKCGEPDFSDRRFETRKVAHKVRAKGRAYDESVKEEVEIEVAIDEWSYDLGRNRFMRHLTFENGRLVNVETGDRGKKQ